MLHATWNNRESNPLFGEPLPKGFLIFPFYRMLKKNHGTSSFYGTSLLLHIHEEGRYGRYRAETNPPPRPPPPLVVVVVLLSWSEVSVQGGCLYTV